jgi:glycosyltransferase involved in cell wall biosynthesis
MSVAPPAGRPLRVAMVVPPYVELPPPRYGGTEAVCAALVDGLVERGHEVTVLGVGRNGTRGRFVASRPDPQSDRMGQLMPEVLHIAQVAVALERLEVDVIHDHTVAGLLTARSRPAPTVATMHAPLEGEMAELVSAVAPPVILVAISDNQRRAAPGLPWAGTVHNAIRVEDFPFTRDKEDYALFLGRACADKGMPNAIHAARSAGIPLRIAAKCVEDAEVAYFDAEVRPLLGPGVEWLGEVGGADKLELLGRARCLLFPIEWEEPFGMVLVEALACGTPVVALRRGAVPEIVEHGVTGFVTDDPDELPALLRAVDRLDPQRCRQEAERRFDVARMAAEYEAVYQRVLGEQARWPSPAPGFPGRDPKTPLTPVDVVGTVTAAPPSAS